MGAAAVVVFLLFRADFSDMRAYYDARREVSKAWVQEFDGGSQCTAWPEERADGCRVGVEGEQFRFEDSRLELKCGEVGKFCGRPYRCECQQCSDWPDYATRMQRGRREQRHGSEITIDYEGGECTAIANPGTSGGIATSGRPFLACDIGFFDESTVGGCRRCSSSDGVVVQCGESLNACDGVVLSCECPDGGDRYVSACGQRLPSDDAVRTESGPPPPDVVF